MTTITLPTSALAFSNQPRAFFNSLHAEFRRLLDQQGRQDIHVALDHSSLEENAPVIEFYPMAIFPGVMASAENVFGIAYIAVRIPCSGEGDSLEDFQLATHTGLGVEKSCSNYEVASDVLTRLAGAIHALLPEQE